MSGGKKGRKEKELDFYVSWCVCLCGGEEAVAARATELETKEEQPDSCGIPVHFPSSP